MTMKRAACLSSLALLLLLPAAAALADAIDGEWCHTDGRHFTINGPDIVTPGNKRIKGDYGRHSFSYVVPAGETPSGAKVDMTLMGETTVSLTVQPPGATPGPAQIWKRCGLRSS